MKQLPLIIIACIISTTALFAQSKDETAIKNILNKQASEWNKADIDAYMRAGYWQSDSLIFIGKSGPTFGFDNTLTRYKKSYSDTTQTGRLTFSNLQLKKLSPVYYFVIGKWELDRKAGYISGYFSLLFKKIHGQWRIVADHSS